ncbi:MAG: thiamine phosphate synthase [Ghiorsea sp.]
MSKHTGIYGILPADLDTALLLEKAEDALSGGVRILQFRDKKSGFKRQLKRAVLLRELTSQFDATFIINDSLQLALDSDADGVHLGRDDVADISKIRQTVAENFILGITCRADARYAKSALDFGANYVSFGAVFPSSTKADVPVIGLPRLHKACQMFPDSNICAIGGISTESLPAVKACGATYAAVISSLFDGTPEQIKNQAEQMVNTWKNAPSA